MHAAWKALAAHDETIRHLHLRRLRDRLLTMIAIGPENFRAMLRGFHLIDEHFRTAPFHRNLPVLMGLMAIWYNNFAMLFPAKTTSKRRGESSTPSPSEHARLRIRARYLGAQRDTPATGRLR